MSCRHGVPAPGFSLPAYGQLNIKQARYSADTAPVDPTAAAIPAAIFPGPTSDISFLSRELLAYRLNAVHNLFYYHSLMRAIRQALVGGYDGSIRANIFLPER